MMIWLIFAVQYLTRCIMCLLPPCPAQQAITGSLMDEVPDALYGTPYDAKKREQGEDWPVAGHNMIGHKRMRQLRRCARRWRRCSARVSRGTLWSWGCGAAAP